MKNLKFALRILLKTPSVTLIAVLSLGLGIGATTAIFSMYDQLMRRPLKVQDPNRLVNFLSPGEKRGSASSSAAGGSDAIFSYPMFRDLEKIQRVFTGVAAQRSFDANLVYRGQTPVGTLGLFVSGSYFPLLGLQPAIGRLLGPTDDATNESPVAVLQHAFWRTHFEASPAVLGQTLLVNGQALKIVGVAPEGFTGTVLGESPEFFVPLRLKEVIPPHEKSLDRFWYWVYVFARLKPGISMEEADSAANATYHAIMNNVEAPLQTDLSERQMAEFRARRLVLESGYRGQSMFLNEDNSDGFLVMLLMTGLVLLIACANVSNLLLARAASRTAEMAVRLSLGASRGNLVSQLLTESLVLAVLGGTAGLVFARLTVDALVWGLFSESWLGMKTFVLDPAVLLFAAIVTLGAGVAFGLFPAIQSAQSGMLTDSPGGSVRVSGTRLAARFRWTLATAQIAMSTALLISAGLFTKSLFNLSKIDVGFNPKTLVAFAVSPNLNGYSSQESRALFERLEAEVAAQPGVTDVTAALVPVLRGVRGTEVSVPGYPSGPEADAGTGFNLIGPGYFHAMGIPLISGREFTASDTWGAPGVVIVNEPFVKKFNLGANPVGKRIGWLRGNKNFDLAIVGVARDAKYSGLKDEAPPMFFSPYRQNGWVGNLIFYVRGRLPEKALVTMIPGVVAKVAPNLGVPSVFTMEQVIRDNVSDDRFMMVLFASFAILATVLAAGGLYGVMSYTVAQRTREFGVRMALGAAPSAIRVMVLRQVAVMTLAGGGVGAAASIGFGRLLESGLFQVKGYDTTVFLVSSVLLGAVAIGAGFIPAHRASKVEPMRALRYE